MKVSLSITTCALVGIYLLGGCQGFLDRSRPATSESDQYDDVTTTEAFLQDSTLDQEDEPIRVDLKSNVTVNCQCGVKAKTEIHVGDINVEGVRRERAFQGWKASEPELLIIPNEPAEAREYPWIAAITKRKWDQKQHVICGGSLINSKFLVTAAHCIKNQPIFRMEVAFYAHNASHEALKEDPLVEVKKIKRFIVHPRWNQDTVDNDIGLIELASPIDFSTSPVRPICLPPTNVSHDQFDGRNATVAGWGYTTPSGPNSKVLNKISVPIYSEKQCQNETIYRDKILPSMICAGYQEGGRDACTNDSGGPLVVEEDGRHILVGIVSWGHGCARPNAPGVYTRVTRYVDWINKQLVRGESCSS